MDAVEKATELVDRFNHFYPYNEDSRDADLSSAVLVLPDLLSEIDKLAAEVARLNNINQEYASTIDVISHEDEQLLDRVEELEVALSNVLDCFWDMSPLEYAASRGFAYMSDEEGEKVKQQAREVLKESSNA